MLADHAQLRAARVSLRQRGALLDDRGVEQDPPAHPRLIHSLADRLDAPGAVRAADVRQGRLHPGKPPADPQVQVVQ
jgi:hypothetical protein